MPYLLSAAMGRLDALQATLIGHRDRLLRAAFSADGLLIVTASADKTVRVWDAQSGRSVSRITNPAGKVYSVAIGPDYTAQVWRVQSTRHVVELAGHGRLGTRAASFSPDGRQVLRTDEECNGRVWDAQSGHPIAVLKGNGELPASFRPDGRHILTASDDGTARIWNFGPKTRSPQTISLQMRCRLPFKWNGDVIVPAQPDPRSQPLPSGTCPSQRPGQPMNRPWPAYWKAGFHNWLTPRRIGFTFSDLSSGQDVSTSLRNAR